MTTTMRRIAATWTLSALVALAIVRLTAAERPEALGEGGLGAEAEQLVALSSRGVGQLTASAPSATLPDFSSSPPSPPAVAAPAEGAFVQVDASSAAAVAEAAADAADPDTGGGCQGRFGVLSEKMTVMGLDPPGGCSPGQSPQDAFAHFVGGSPEDCKPPTDSGGCYRYVIARYGDACDLDGLYSALGTRVSLSSSSKIDKDGLYMPCNQAPELITRTMRYIGSGTCSEAYCQTAAEQNAATRASSLWACSLLATFLALLLR